MTPETAAPLHDAKIARAAGPVREPPQEGLLVTPATIVPGWYGERLDLDYAIHACFANAEYQARQRDKEEQPAGHATAPEATPEPEPCGPRQPKSTSSTRYARYASNTPAPDSRPCYTLKRNSTTSPSRMT